MQQVKKENELLTAKSKVFEMTQQILEIFFDCTSFD